MKHPLKIKTKYTLYLLSCHFFTSGISLKDSSQNLLIKSLITEGEHFNWLIVRYHQLFPITGPLVEVQF